VAEEDRLRLQKRLKGRLDKEGEALFAYVYGSLFEGRPFRDLDIAIWIRSRQGLPTTAGTSQPSWRLS
jgi:predicted nucleotidyltransferase